MSLRAYKTIDTFINKIICNKEIMQLMNLPYLDKNDTEIISNRKKNLIKRCISKSAQNPYELGDNFPKEKIGNIEYKDYGKIRITVTFAQSIKMDSDLFGNPQIDIFIYYDNTNMENVFKILDLISDEFSGKTFKIETQDDKYFIRNIKCEGQTAQTSIINNYERIGIRFSFFATLYKI